MLHILRSKTTVMGTGSVAFGFKRIHDAYACVELMRSMGPMVKVWYTATSPDKFVLTSAPQKEERDNSLDFLEVHSVETNDFLREMLDSNLSVRLIDELSIDHQLTTLYSHSGYEPYYSSEEAVVLLERAMQL
jgi:hypothetical protein